MAEIVLSTLNARYHHASFGLRYLYANLGELRSRAEIREFTINQSAREIAERLLENRALKILGLGVYIWNVELTAQLVSLLRQLRPELIIVLGGPEVSHETERQPFTRLADAVIRGEADLLFAQFCRDRLAEAPREPQTQADPAPRECAIIDGPLPELKKLALPYEFYGEEDIRHRVIYVEASRGCPYKCEYCLSSLDKSVRSFDLDRFLDEMDRLIARGVRQFKFVDRTFNLSIPTSLRILEFFLARIERGLFVHFELVPDRLPAELRAVIAKFPAGALQFEIGIQTFNPEVSRLISRRQDHAKIRENFAYLTEHTGVHLHADLIAGLPGETVQSFAAGFDALNAMNPHEIQVGILKRLRGTPITRHDSEWQMRYQEFAPYSILQNRTMSFAEIRRMERFSRFWDLIANSGNFRKTVNLVKAAAREESFFGAFDRLTGFLERRHPQTHGIALLALVESLWEFLRQPAPGGLGLPADVVRTALLDDYCGTVKRDPPRFLRENSVEKTSPRLRPAASHAARQARHQASLA